MQTSCSGCSRRGNNYGVDDLFAGGRIRRAARFCLSYDKINNLDHIRAMEQSLKESLNRIQVHKENCGKQLISVDYNGQFHKDMHLPMGLSYAQGASSVSWLHDNDGQPLMISQDANLIPHRDVGCSSDTALQNYPAYFNADKQTKADEQVTDESFHNFSPNTCLRLQLGAQFSYQTYGQNLLSERMFKPEMEHSLQESTIDYQVHHFETPGMGYDASFHDWASTSGNCGVAIYDERSYTQEEDKLANELVDEEDYDIEAKEYYFHHATLDKEEEMVFEHFEDDYSNAIDFYAFDVDNDMNDSLWPKRTIPIDIAEDTFTLIV
ncbi:hypothetical protein ZIOFF_060280 [Zingiber officinale]|uniref:Uncharacterized protein n=1 Tax=Zingiber officinale TaxID=94328 RepID=A0A8J5FBH6_ZINOF|nr:hypothetical protein ZIOFF_060280 [Zingiber officinale]